MTDQNSDPENRKKVLLHRQNPKFSGINGLLVKFRRFNQLVLDILTAATGATNRLSSFRPPECSFRVHPSAERSRALQRMLRARGRGAPRFALQQEREAGWKLLLDHRGLALL
ncbi:Hypothetical predicted protein [Xyrichtys novacula]|uniref:Uncharacterized protein n=1 Tax=Xyrichtys novacula TaxID=13765 RepID=A0AAV1GFX6_XYRNO|nr:Hypothetical predicted protein [Xyrichtys novacula]